jgi:signal transduction histidine kinase
MGLGLSVCRTIMATHGGSIHARNNAGAGATAWIALPVWPR